jgi:hypothetical protein
MQWGKPPQLIACMAHSAERFLKAPPVDCGDFRELGPADTHADIPLVSGEVGIIKPDPRLYELLLDRFCLDPRRVIHIDDVALNLLRQSR